MKLYVLRHTSAADPHGFDSDRERPLTESGRIEARQVAQMMKRLDYLPDLVMTSPYLRTRETARIITDFLRLEPPEETSSLLPAFHPEDLMKEISGRSVGAILVVGHAPDVAHFVTAVCFAEAPPGLLYSKGTFAAIDVERPVRRRSGLLHALIPVAASEKLGQ